MKTWYQRWGSRLLTLAWIIGYAACGTGTDAAFTGGSSTSSSTTPGTSSSGSNGNSTNGSEGSTGNSSNPNTSNGEGGNGYYFMGRVPTDTNTFSWAGSNLSIAFNGSMGNFKLNPLSGNNYVGVSIDGGAMSISQVTTGVPINFGPLAQGNHVVVMSKLSEPRLGVMSLSGYQTDGEALNITAKKRKIEIIGDSISVGYGVDCSSASQTNSAATEDATASYGALAANSVSADYSIIAWAGKGLYRNEVIDNSNLTMPDYWPEYIAGDSGSVYTFPKNSQPQVVVIALGTNDYEYMDPGPNGNLVLERSPLDNNQFVQSYISFLQTINGKYPGANYVLCSSPMLVDGYPLITDTQHTSLLTNLNTVQSTLSNFNITVLDFPAMNSSQNTGCDNHPNRAYQQTMGTLLTGALQHSLGW